MRLRQLVWVTLPAALFAIFALAPGLSAAAHAPAKHHKAAKAHTHAVAKHVSTHTAAHHKVTHKVAVRRVRYRKVVHRYHFSHYRSRFSPSPSRIGQIQQALARTGFYSGEPTGRWDSQTIEAMKSFQQAHNLPPTGKIDATTLQELGLGSDIAGLAPPRPVIGPAPSGSSE